MTNPVNQRRLGYGAFEPGVYNPRDKRFEAGHWVSAYTACWKLLEAVRDRHITSLDDLARFVEEFPDAVEREYLAEERVSYLRAWVRGHRLECDLVLLAAFKTVVAWRRDPIARSERRWAFPEVDYVFPAFDRKIVDPADFSRKEWIDIYDARADQLKTAGASRTSLKDPDQFRWLADLLVGRKTYSAIAKANNVDVTAVNRDLKRLAVLIGLKLPPADPGGRPRKHLTKSNRKYRM